MSAQLFRANVGVVIAGKDGRVLVFERYDIPNAWQFPQGGLEENEAPLSGAYRELFEETNLREQDVDFISEYPEWLVYELPPELRLKRPDMRGQVQRWFIFRLTANEQNIQLEANKYPEFTRYKWVTPTEAAQEAIHFRQAIYQKLAAYITTL